MLGWLCLLGWLLLFTVVTLVLNALSDFQNGMGRAFGWPAPATNWTAVKIFIGAVWLISIILKVAIWGWW